MKGYGEVTFTVGPLVGCFCDLGSCEEPAQLRQLIERLQDGEEVSSRGVVLVKRLLCDGASPLYIESSDGALADELTIVCQALDRSR